MATSERDLSHLEAHEFDIAIVGGGISGAWLALHTSLAGLKTVVLDKHDFASQTSSASSKLLHGGVRYLQQMQFHKVRESAMERAEYIYAAPHLSHAVPFIVPTYRDFARSKFFLSCGMLAYQLLCLGENRVIDASEEKLPGIRRLSRSGLNQLCDLSNEPHTGGVVFHERHMLDSERMVLAILRTAEQAGAKVVNYLQAKEYLLDDNTVRGLAVTDCLSGDNLSVHAKLTINAAGPWIDGLNKQLPKAEQAPSISGYALGSHIITRKIADHAIAITTKHQSNAVVDRGGRHVFLIPWRNHSLIGTSYDEIAEPKENAPLLADHVQQLLDAVNDGLPSANLQRHDIISGYSGLYPLQTDNIQSTVYQGSGEYQIVDHARSNGIEGLVTALGAKYTTGRKLSELTLRLVSSKLNRKIACKRLKLVGSDYSSFKRLCERKNEQYGKLLSPSQIRHLLHLYGTEIDKVVSLGKTQPELLETIVPEQTDLWVQLIWAIKYEHLVNLHDFLFHRSSLGLLGINHIQIQQIADRMALELNWSHEQIRQQVRVTTTRIDAMQSAIHGQ